MQYLTVSIEVYDVTNAVENLCGKPHKNPRRYVQWQKVLPSIHAV
jgi:hypothetical protein